MAYKMVDLLEKLCGRVAGAAIEHRALITDALVRRFKHKLPEGQTVPDIYQLQTWLAEELYENHAEVVASEKSLKSELTEDRQDRKLRARYVSEVRQHLFSARGIFDAIYGAGGSNVMFEEPPGFEVRIDPVPLYRQGVTVHDNILDPDFRRPDLRVDVDVNLDKLARRMEPSLEGLHNTLAVLNTGTQASNASLERKEDGMASLDLRIGLGARLLEALYAWAEHEGIARRVRLSSHRTAGGNAAGGEPGAEAPGTEALRTEALRTEALRTVALRTEAPDAKAPSAEAPGAKALDAASSGTEAPGASEGGGETPGGAPAAGAAKPKNPPPAIAAPRHRTRPPGDD